MHSSKCRLYKLGLKENILEVCWGAFCLVVLVFVFLTRSGS